MARKYKIITREDRQAIERAYLGGATAGAIAAKIGVATSSVYREIAWGYTGHIDRNGRPAYSATVAQAEATEKMSCRGHPFTR